jgi:hypothetical protein
MKKGLTLIASAALIIFVTGLNCHVDQGLEPVRSAIEGTITFTGSWPGDPAEVRLVSAKKFPPSDISEIDIGEAIPTDVSSYSYTYYVDPGTYPFIGVAWREKDSVWDVLSICGVYFSGSDSLAPSEIVIPSDTSMIQNIDIRVNRSKAHKVTDTKITGSISSSGTWPADITEARVIATTKFSLVPTVLPSLLDLAFSDKIVPGTTQTDYVIKAFPGKFVATGVLFFKQGHNLSLTDIIYSAQIGGLSLGEYEVQEDSTGHGPDFNVQF